MLGDRPGYFVEVGTFDGVHLSNSYSFELGGWNGLCVEASPRFSERGSWCPDVVMFLTTPDECDALDAFFAVPG